MSETIAVEESEKSDESAVKLTDSTKQTKTKEGTNKSEESVNKSIEDKIETEKIPIDSSKDSHKDSPSESKTKESTKVDKQQKEKNLVSKIESKAGSPKSLQLDARSHVFGSIIYQSSQISPIAQNPSTVKIIYPTATQPLLMALGAYPVMARDAKLIF